MLAGLAKSSFFRKLLERLNASKNALEEIYPNKPEFLAREGSRIMSEEVRYTIPIKTNNRWQEMRSF